MVTGVITSTGKIFWTRYAIGQSRNPSRKSRMFPLRSSTWATLSFALATVWILTHRLNVL